VSISLRAKIKSARDLHIDIARFVLVGFVDRGATRLLALILFYLALLLELLSMA
jgi:hypothetical protein